MDTIQCNSLKPVCVKAIVKAKILSIDFPPNMVDLSGHVWCAPELLVRETAYLNNYTLILDQLIILS